LSAFTPGAGVPSPQAKSTWLSNRMAAGEPLRLVLLK
jgi:hypothetical protein